MERNQSIIDCHGHYTTAPTGLEDWRNLEIAGIRDPSRMKASKLQSSDDEPASGERHSLLAGIHAALHC